jgi:hypothetical protein
MTQMLPISSQKLLCLPTSHRGEKGLLVIHPCGDSRSSLKIHNRLVSSEDSRRFITKRNEPYTRESAVHNLTVIYFSHCLALASIVLLLSDLPLEASLRKAGRRQGIQCDFGFGLDSYLYSS